MFGLNANTANRTVHQMANSARRGGPMPLVSFVKPRSTTQKVFTYGGWAAFGTAALTYGGLVVKHLATKDGVFKNIEKHYAHQGLTKDSGLWAKLTHSFGKASEELTLLPYTVTKKIGEFFEKKAPANGGNNT